MRNFVRLVTVFEEKHIHQHQQQQKEQQQQQQTTEKRQPYLLGNFVGFVSVFEESCDVVKNCEGDHNQHGKPNKQFG